MKLSVLTENVAGTGFLAEHGLSYLIEIHGKTILFDTGHTDVFLKNAKKLGVNLQEKVDIVVLSHGHWDHGDGLQFIRNKTLITHPKAFIKRLRKNDKSNIGLKLTENTLQKQFNVITTREPFYIDDNIIFLGEIPHLYNFESQPTPYTDEHGNPDLVIDDSALAITENNTLIIVTGCSHSGICNIIDYAKKITGIQTIKTVIGGFHLKLNNLQTQQTIAFFKQVNVKKIYPSHCTELPALTAFYVAFNITQLKTGMQLEL